MEIIQTDHRFNIMQLSNSERKEVIRIDPEGRIFWKGREVETDEDFRAAMLELAYALGKKR